MTAPILRVGFLRISLLDLFLFLGFVCFSSDVVDKLLRATGLDDLVFLAIYAGTLGWILLFRIFPSVLVVCPILIVMLAIPALSTFWSVDPGQTAYRALGVIGSSLFGILLGWTYGPAVMLERLMPAFLLTLMGSLFVIFFVPSLGLAQTTQWVGTWVGLHLHKNSLGGMASLAVLVFTYAWFTSSYRLLVLLGLFLSLVLLVGSRSATGQVTTLIGLVMGAGIWWLQRAPRSATLLVMLGTLLVPVLAIAFWRLDLSTTLLEMMGKDTTFGSRISIWALVWPYIEDRWWLGYGYGAFWTADLPWVDLITARLNFTPFYSHNGLVELWLGGGSILVALALLVFAQAWLKAWVPVFAQRTRAEHAFAVVFLTTFVLRNVTEATALTRNGIIWVIFVALVVSLAREVVFKVSPARQPAGAVS